MGSKSSTVARLRADLKLSQSAFGAEIGITQAAVSMIEHGRQRLTAELALRILDRWPDQVHQLGGVEVLLRGAAA